MAAMFRLLLGTLGAVATLAPAAPATTWVVDAAGGGQFTDIQTAILASQPGDVLLVQPGTYAPFALDRGLTIIGYGVCNVTGGMTIAGLPASQTAALVGFRAQVLDIQSCDGAVLVQDVQQLQTISVTNSDDVRMARTAVPYAFWTSIPPISLYLSGSRLEVVDSQIFGGSGDECAIPEIDGGVGATCANSRLHLSRSRLAGGTGSGCWTLPNFWGGDGATGLDMQAGADVILCGRTTDMVNGGSGGANLYYLNDCSFDGWPGYSVMLGGGATLRRSGITIGNYSYYYGIHCVYFSGPGIAQLGGTEVLPALADPTLNISGNPVPGGTLVVTLDAPAGSTALLGAGRKAVVVQDPNTVIEVLTPVTRTVSLGVIPASGTTTINLQVPSVLAPGTKIFLQAEVSVAPGDLRRTNSVPVIVR